jgi:peptidoglycan LD-endopeptidase LytH
MPALLHRHYEHRLQTPYLTGIIAAILRCVRSAAKLLLVLAVAATGWHYRAELLRYLPATVVATSPHAQYAAALRARGLDETELGRKWLTVADAAVAEPRAIGAAFTHHGEFDDGAPDAIAWRFAARRGQRIVVSAEFASGELFLDLLDVDGKKVLAGHTAAAPLAYEVGADGEFLLRAQPEILRAGTYRVEQITEASLTFPVRGISPSSVHGPFGAPRDGGRRRHEGIDIFAPRGTAVIAAVDGWITGATTNRLGGNVVWLWAPSRRVALYYAHLDRHAVSRGERVEAGEVLGYVGTTGNARGTPPHLHFGVYATGEGAVDPAPFVVSPARGPARRRATALRPEHVMQPSSAY